MCSPAMDDRMSALKAGGKYSINTVLNTLPNKVANIMINTVPNTITNTVTVQRELPNTGEKNNGTVKSPDYL